MMRTASTRFSLSIALWLAFACLIARPIPVAADSCQFSLGFLTLEQMIPDVVGDCIVNEHYSPINGDGLQETTHGLLVWRKSDNWTAFTDGYHTWINGPLGLQKRLNSQRFSWESAPASCSIDGDALSFAPATIAGDGNATGPGSIHNPCDQAANLMIDVLTESRDGPRAIADAPTIFLSDVPPDATRSFTYQVVMAIPNSTPQTQISWFTDSPNNWMCVNVGASSCLEIDPWLKSAVTALLRLDEGRALLRIAADNGVRIQRGQTGPSLLASYSPASKLVTLDSSLDLYSSWVRATILSHELQHAADDAAGNLTYTPSNCYLAEETAYRRQAQVWADLWQDHLPPDIDPVHRMLNDITLTVARDPSGFVQTLIAAYHQECDSNSPSN